MSKIFILGIDGAPPEYIFGGWLDELPTIKKLMEKGCYAKLNSSVPPLSAIAWTSMVTGKTPSDTGIFEYVYRKDNSYTDIHVISSLNVKDKTVWQIASENNKKSIICLMPLTWPIKPFNGVLISGFMVPGTDCEYAHPKKIKQEINSLFEEQFLINSDYKSDYESEEVSEENLIKESYRISEMHFKLMKYLLKNKEWDLFFGIIIETDAINHNFLKYADPKHRKYDPDSKFKNTIKEYYKFIDRNLKELLNLLDEDTKIIVLSDHGIKRIHNRINLSDWLIKEGYLVLKKPIKEKTRLDMDMIDWDKTKAWAIGAYEGQIFINLKGKELKGVVEPEEYYKLIDELKEKLGKITGDDGSKLNTKFFIKKKDYDGKKRDIAPDMIIYFDDLQYGCNTSLIGNKNLWSIHTAFGSVDSGHSQQGIFIMDDGKCKGNLNEIDILDVTPTILNKLNIEIPEDMKGKIIGD